MVVVVVTTTDSIEIFAQLIIECTNATIFSNSCKFLTCNNNFDIWYSKFKMLVSYNFILFNPSSGISACFHRHA